jgi:predicted dehydrogenase
LECGALAALGVSTAARAVEAPRRERKRRIGFVDDDLNNYHANVFLQAARGPLKERGFSVTGCTGLKKEEGQVWAEKNGVPWFDTAEALDAVVDFYMVLAPSTPETHLELCRRVFPFSKPVYVDKTFAPDLATAREIFGLADRHGTPIQTSSALRYTNVQEEARNLDPNEVEHMITWGAGGSFAEYAIHPVELLISLMGAEAVRLMRRGPEHRSQLLLEFAGNRTGVVNVYTRSNTPFAASVTTAKQTRYIEVDVSKIFVNTMAAQLDFFELGAPQVDRRETLAIMGILDAAREEKDAWHQLR